MSKKIYNEDTIDFLLEKNDYQYVFAVYSLPSFYDKNEYLTFEYASLNKTDLRYSLWHLKYPSRFKELYIIDDNVVCLINQGYGDKQWFYDVFLRFYNEFIKSGESKMNIINGEIKKRLTEEELFARYPDFNPYLINGDELNKFTIDEWQILCDRYENDKYWKLYGNILNTYLDSARKSGIIEYQGLAHEYRQDHEMVYVRGFSLERNRIDKYSENQIRTQIRFIFSHRKSTPIKLLDGYLFRIMKNEIDFSRYEKECLEFAKSNKDKYKQIDENRFTP